LAVLGDKRFEGLPEVATVDETVRGYAAYSWGGLGAPSSSAQ
jgi:hypothetical protein